VQAAQSEIELSGAPDGLQFAWQPGQDPSRSSSPRGEGCLCLVLAGEVLWGDEGSAGVPTGVEADWGLFLEHLAGAWPWLTLEEGYPLGFTPLSPGKLWRYVEEQSGGVEGLSDGEYEALVRFEHRHDLAAGLDGIILPRLLVLREGKQCWLECPDRDLAVRRPWAEVHEVLTQMGEALAAHIGTQGKAGEDLARFWQDRAERARTKFFALRSGLTDAERGELVTSADEAVFWEADDDDSEILAAARMTVGVTGTDVVARVLRNVRDLPPVQTPALDALGDRVQMELASRPSDERPYEIGHAVAGYVREQLGLAMDAPFLELEDRLREWGVMVREESFDPEGQVDAVACWGPGHGPAVLLNTVSAGRTVHVGGRRSTLAHELCHLLLDREGSLPLAEVLGGAAPRWVERRANAFAAELLLPREAALDAVKEAFDLETALRDLTQSFCVSQQLAANQIRNAPGFELVVTEAQEQARLRWWAGIPFLIR